MAYTKLRGNVPGLAVSGLKFKTEHYKYRPNFGSQRFFRRKKPSPSHCGKPLLAVVFLRFAISIIIIIISY